MSTEIEAYVQQKIASGVFRSREEFAETAIRLYRAIESRQAEIRKEVQVGLAELDSGLEEPWEIESVLADLRKWASEAGIPD